MTRRTASRGRGRAFTIGVLALAGGIGAYVLGVLSPLGQQAEARVLGEAAFTTTPPPPLNLVSIPAVGLMLLVVGLFALAVHGVRCALVVTIVPVVGIFISQLLKQQFLARPGLFELDAPNTFPSGHMTIFVLFTAALIWTVPGAARAIVALLGAVVLGVVAWQLLEYGWHRPSDVLGSLALGVLAFSAAAFIAPSRDMSPTRFGAPTRGFLIGGGIVLVVAGVVIALVATVRDSPGMMLFAGELGVIGASTLSVWALLSLQTKR